MGLAFCSGKAYERGKESRGSVSSTDGIRSIGFLTAALPSIHCKRRRTTTPNAHGLRESCGCLQCSKKLSGRQKDGDRKRYCDEGRTEWRSRYTHGTGNVPSWLGCTIEENNSQMEWFGGWPLNVPQRNESMMES
jgi:hypothetical protein